MNAPALPVVPRVIQVARLPDGTRGVLFTDPDGRTHVARTERAADRIAQALRARFDARVVDCYGRAILRGAPCRWVLP